MAQALFARGDPQFDPIESAQWQAAQVSITSIANCLGRVIFGLYLDSLMCMSLKRWTQAPLPTLLSITITGGGLILLAVSVSRLYYLSYCCTILAAYKCFGRPLLL